MFENTQRVFCYAGAGRMPVIAEIVDFGAYTVNTIHGPRIYRRLRLQNGTEYHCREDFICASLEEYREKFIEKKT